VENKVASLDFSPLILSALRLDLIRPADIHAAGKRRFSEFVRMVRRVIRKRVRD
jgi:hypothetical protein